jgi:hypothetical protein
MMLLDDADADIDTSLIDMLTTAKRRRSPLQFNGIFIVNMALTTTTSTNNNTTTG